MNKDLSIKILNEVLNHLGMNPKQLSEHLGKERPQWIYDVLNPSKKVGISKNIASLIKEKHPEISLPYLLTGEGELLTQQRSELDINNEIVRFRIMELPKPEEKPTKTGFSLVDGFSEKLRLLGYEAPKEDKGYKMIALDLAERVNKTASMSEEMLGMVSKPLLDRIGLLEKEKAMVEARAAALEAKLAAMSKKEAK